MASVVIKRDYSLVLVGKTGSGKSSLGNSLLCYDGTGEKPFMSKKSASSITKICARQRATLNDGTLLTIIDTPGLFDTKKPNGKIINEIVKCIGLSAPGPHVILFVLSLNRFTKEEIDTVEILKKLFGRQAMKHVIIVFTGKDGLVDDDDIKTVTDYIENGPEELQEYVEECNNRYVGISNIPDKPTHKSDVKDVMDLIYKTIKENGNQVYSQEAFAESERIIQAEIERRRLTSNKSENEIREEIMHGIESNDVNIMYTLGKGLKKCLTHALSVPGTLIETALSIFKSN